MSVNRLIYSYTAVAKNSAYVYPYKIKDYLSDANVNLTASFLTKQHYILWITFCHTCY